jgi:hypothetical protein
LWVRYGGHLSFSAPPESRSAATIAHPSEAQ